MKKLFLGVLTALALAAGGTFAGTLDDVKARGNLLCGVSTGAPGFATVDDSGKDVGFDVDYCRALAAAIFGDPMAVKFVGLTSAVRFTALAAGEVDILARNTTWTYSRDTDLKQTFLGVNYYDGQGFMVKKELGVKSTTELDGATVCIQVGTTTELNLADYFKENGMSYEPVPTADNAESQQQYLAGACDTYTTDASALHGTRVNLENPDDHLVLPEIISKEPLGPLVRHGDDNWADIGRWVLNALIIAEEKAILGLDKKSQIISTGGSAVYSSISMNHLMSFSKVIYIDTPLDVVIERIGFGQERGLAVPEGMTIAEVFEERKPLYEKFSQGSIDGSKAINDLIILIENIINE